MGRALLIGGLIIPAVLGGIMVLGGGSPLFLLPLVALVLTIAARG